MRRFNYVIRIEAKGVLTMHLTELVFYFGLKAKGAYIYVISVLLHIFITCFTWFHVTYLYAVQVFNAIDQKKKVFNPSDEAKAQISSVHLAKNNNITSTNISFQLEKLYNKTSYIIAQLMSIDFVNFLNHNINI